MTALDLDVTVSGRTLCARVSGAVTPGTVDEFAALLERLLTAAFPVTVLEVTALSRLCFAGALALAQLHEEILITGRVLHVVCGADGPRATLDAFSIEHRPADR